ncbi:aminotransferase class V-fold PLP-dependent enzyme [Crossiella sp. CA-258035]|uniref:aminotransferase class V-fold PLP-dependent enzyme n=1 Tax=Crossiella sp. CA-258035 TaxID=2981138 RepID=UPI0024BD2960|nr:aminotransferase class V-fold PLP-dependent enzyme [Crossiella sp. CA-258035]WHT17822.1 aminotransferase class V-fold PLP-dependent enzyme [Crossiella sp. CA-258035]
MIDLDRVRADTPGCQEQVFLDSAGSSLPPEPVLAEVIGHLRREAEVGGYRAEAERAEDLDAGYQVAADFFGCAPTDVAFTDSATRSWLLGMSAVPLAAGDRILVSQVEYGSNAIALMQRAQEFGATVELVPSAEDGSISVPALTAMLDERVKLVSVVHMPTNGGLVNPAKEIIDAAHQVGAIALLDACQTAGQRRVRLDELGADLISVTGRKWLRGPRGTGLLVVNPVAAPRLRPPLVDQHSGDWSGLGEWTLRQDARVHELWESSIADRLGLIAALRYAEELGIDDIQAAVVARADFLRAELSALPGVTVHDLGTERGGIATFTVAGVDGEAVKKALVAKDITVSVGGTTGALLDMTARGLAQVVRASPHYFVSQEQLVRFVTAVAEIAA